MILEIDNDIPFSRRHKNETIREIIRYDSGSLKDLLKKDERVCFSEQCFELLCVLTKGHKENWVKPEKTENIFDSLKPYAVPYLYDFNDPALKELNDYRLTKENL